MFSFDIIGVLWQNKTLVCTLCKVLMVYPSGTSAMHKDLKRKALLCSVIHYYV